MILTLAVLALILSLFAPWYIGIALAAGIYSFRKKSHREILLTSGAIFIFHVFAAFLLDLQSDFLVSRRMGGLFGLPVHAFVYPLTALGPTLLFLITSYTVIEARGLVQRKPKKSDRKP